MFLWQWVQTETAFLGNHLEEDRLWRWLRQSIQRFSWWWQRAEFTHSIRPNFFWKDAGKAKRCSHTGNISDYRKEAEHAEQIDCWGQCDHGLWLCFDGYLREPVCGHGRHSEEERWNRRSQKPFYESSQKEKNSWVVQGRVEEEKEGGEKAWARREGEEREGASQVAHPHQDQDLSWTVPSHQLPFRVH